MATNPLTDIVMATALIKATMPQQYQELCSALRALEAQAIAELASTTGRKGIYKAQGKHQFVQQLRKHVVECAELRETFTRRNANG